MTEKEGLDVIDQATSCEFLIPKYAGGRLEIAQPSWLVTLGPL
jgi:hypothetical protein